MEKEQDLDWGKVRKELKKIKLKTIRFVHRINNQYKITEKTKALIVAGALKVVMTLSPGNAALAQNVKEYDNEAIRTEQKKFLAKADLGNSIDMHDAYRKISKHIDNREEDFAKRTGDMFEDYIERVRGAKGHKNAVLRESFGSDTNCRFYCSRAGIELFKKLIKQKGFFEYEFLLKCIANIDYCPSVVNGLNEYSGEDGEGKTNNILRTLKEEQTNHPNSVFIVLKKSKTNTSSGLHFVIVAPEYAADTLVYVNNEPQMKVYGFNSEIIKDVNTYFKGIGNRGYVYNLTALGREKLMKIYYDNMPIIDDNMNLFNQKALPKYKPVALPIDAKNMLNDNTFIK